MYGYFSYYPTFPSLSSFSTTASPPRFPYPSVDIKIFEHSVHAFGPLMEQGSKLLGRLSDPTFAHQIMNAAQEGKTAQVDQLVKSIGLRVPITTHFTPSSVMFTLHLQENQHEPISCCALTVTLKWGR
jgi:hypothetical protein